MAKETSHALIRRKVQRKDAPRAARCTGIPCHSAADSISSPARSSGCYMIGGSRGAGQTLTTWPVTPTGIYVIDAKKYRGRPQLKIEGGMIRQRVERLLVGTRDCTKLVDGVLKQVELVSGLLHEQAPVHGVRCFVGADWPLICGAFTTRGVQAMRPKKLYPKLQAEGPFDADALAEIRRKLAHALPAA